MSTFETENCRPIKIAHVLYRLDIGGMENGLVNLINRLPKHRFSHIVICVTYATDFRHRINRNDVEIVELHKPDGNHAVIYRQLYSIFRRVRPNIVHTRNLGALDLEWSAFAARCPVRIHSEHGWDAADLEGRSRKYRFIRRLCDPAVHRYIAVSKDIKCWLRDVIGIADHKIEQIYNGVDTDKFYRNGASIELPLWNKEQVVFATVGRQDAIKGLDVFLDAVNLLLNKRPDLSESIYVVLAGDGPEHDRCLNIIRKYELTNIAYLPGAVVDVPALLRSVDVFVQPSLNEGISNTILEAMATNLPIVATAVGGNAELVRDGQEGYLVASGDAAALATCLERYIDEPDLRAKHGDAARQRVETQFSLDAMVDAYAAVYSRLAKCDMDSEAA